VKLANQQNAVAIEHKLSGYLLSSSHAYSRHKGMEVCHQFGRSPMSANKAMIVLRSPSGTLFAVIGGTVLSSMAADG
jgi:hypothetical protein